MNILIGGDLVPTVSNFLLFNSADVNTLLGKELLSIWYSATIRIFNLEVPLCDNEEPIAKCGPNLIAPTDTINGIKNLKPSLVALANNHILDQGAQGLKSTIDVLSQNGIPFVGAGYNLKEASKPYIIEKNNIKIGIYACAEHEFSIANDDSPGANPFDPLESLDHIKDLKNKCDYVIVLYHGGKEHYRYPSPYLQKVCRKIARKGADVVICQHSHCIGCYEEFEGSTIVYGQGNFIFDDSESDFWKTSLLVEVDINKEHKVSYIPIIKNANVVRLAEDIEVKEILKGFQRRSEEILKPGFVEKNYNEFALNNYLFYIRKFAGMRRLLSKVDRIFMNNLLVKHKYNNKQLLAIQNYIECEAHRELILTELRILTELKNH